MFGFSQNETFHNTDQLHRKTEIQIQLMKRFELEEMYWNEHSVEILNISTVTNGKKEKNTIYSLEHENKIIEGDENLLIHGTDNYKELVGEQRKPSMQLDPLCQTDMEKVTS